MATAKETTKTKKGGLRRFRGKDKAQVKRTKELYDKCGKYVIASESGDEIRVVLIGKTGSGKSLLGNNLLQKNDFEHDGGSHSVTKQCKLSQRGLDGKSTLCVVDSPGLFDTKDPNEQICKEIIRSIVVATPGPHVYIFVVSIGRHTQEQTDTVENLLEMFGEEVVKHVIVVFTRKDDLRTPSRTPQADFIRNSPDSLQNLLQRCENRYAFINNVASHDKIQDDVNVILDLIYKTVGGNKGDYYTNDMYEKANEVLDARRMEIGTEKERTAEQLLKEQDQIFEEATKLNCAEMEKTGFLNDFREFSNMRQGNCRATNKIEKQKQLLTLKMKAEDRQLPTRRDERQKNEEELRQCEEQISRLEEDDKVKKLERTLEKKKEQIIDASGDSYLTQTILKLVEVNEKLVDNDRINPNRELKKEVLTDEKLLEAVGSAVMKVGLDAGSAARTIGSGMWDRLKKRWFSKDS